MSDQPAGASAKHDAYAALRIPNYRRFASGFVLSSTGLQMLTTAISWEIYERTSPQGLKQAAMALGYIGLARALPVVLLSMPAGHAADVFNRKWVLCCTQLAFALLTLLLALASWETAPIWTYYVLLTLMGCARSFNGPSRQSLLPLIVPRDVFQNAVTWNSGVFQFSAILGPLFAGAMLAHFEVAWPVYLVTAAATAANAVSVAMVEPREQQRPTGKFTPAAMMAGMSHVWKERTIFGALALDLFAVLLGGATALMPIFAKELVRIDPLAASISGPSDSAVVLGILRSAPFVGALVVSLFLAHRPPFRRAGPALLWSVVAFGLCTIGFGLSTSLVLSLGLLFTLGAVDTVSVVIRHVLVQYHTPDQLRGRVGAVNSVFIECSNELGGFESGLVASYFGPVIAVVSGGIGTIVVVGALALAIPELRRLRTLHERAEEPAGK